MTKRSKTKIIPVLKASLIASVALIFSACSSTQKAPSSTAYETVTSTQAGTYTTTPPIFTQPIEQIELDGRSSPLNEIESLINSEQYDLALSKIDSTDKKQLSLNEQARLNLAKASILSVKDQNTQCLITLSIIPLSLLNNYKTSLESLAERNAFLQPKDQAHNQAMMTKISSSLSINQLNSINQETNNPDLQYWFSQQNFSSAPEQQYSHSQNYIPENSQSITANNLRRIDSNWNTNSPKKLAVLLPFSSKFSKAANQFKDGFNKAHAGNLSYKPSVQFYDVGSSDISSTILKANKEGADLIIGPLGNKAAEVALSSRSRAPVLALGGISNGGRHLTFALNPESEIRAIVQHAKAKGLKSALVFAPNSARGNRLASAFKTLWNSNQHRSELHTFAAGEFDHSASIKGAMGIYGSEYRHSKLDNIIGIKTKFTAVKKQNIDMIFLASNFTDAKNLKPQLNYYDGHKVPTYGLSSVNTDASIAEKSDLDGLIIPEMPAIIDASSTSKLEALGHDVYQLIPLLETLQSNPNTGYQGKSGLLSLDSQGNTKRSPSWAKFSSGKLSPH